MASGLVYQSVQLFVSKTKIVQEKSETNFDEIFRRGGYGRERVV